ncbi:MAG: sugar transferase [Gammaproteobacteria bacterium]|nr:sugar transferase [Gammaproteobacteria bacterium]
MRSDTKLEKFVGPTQKLLLLVTDLLCIGIGFLLATRLRLSGDVNYWGVEYIGLNMIIVLTLFIGGAYSSKNIRSTPKLPLKTFFIIVASSVPCLVFIYSLGPERFSGLLGRGVFPVAIFLFACMSVLLRYLINQAFQRKKSSSHVLFLSRDSERLDKEITTDLSSISNNIIKADRITAEAASLETVVIAPDFNPTREEHLRLINLRVKGVPIYSLSDFFETHLYIVPVQEIDDDWFVRSEGFAMLHSSAAIRFKRFNDILIATVLLLISAPLVVTAMAAIKLSSRGPAIFSQTRVGLNGKQFTLYKLRTMVCGAEEKGAQWASKKDPRIFPVGRFLRNTRIDELPQCWNILKGEMSLIGPRPERPEFTEQLSKLIPHYDLRHVIKPGLTGWAQVMYPYGASTYDALKKLQYDLYYIKNYSPILDLNILLRTILVTLRRSGR